MNILALETSTEACSAALLLNSTNGMDGEISERYQLAPREHSQLILPMLDSLLNEAGLALAQIDAIAFGCGPGSFTGVRIATSVAQGIAFGADLPVCAVSTLAALAQGAFTETGAPQVLAAIDARMGEVYCGAYIQVAGLMVLQGFEGVYAPGFVPLPGSASGEWFGTGTGWDAHAMLLRERLGVAVSGCDAQRHPRARDVAVLAAAMFSQGLAVSAEQAMPVYLRNEVAWKKQPKPALGQGA